MIDETDMDDGGRPEAAVNEGMNKKAHTDLMHSLEHGRHDGVGPIFMRHDLQKKTGHKVGTWRTKTAIDYGKVCKQPSKVG